MENARKVVCITGCTRGLGRAMAERFSDEGWEVAGCGRDKKALEGLAAVSGAGNWFSVADMADEESVAVFCEGVLRELRAPDLLINNAGVINRNAPLWEVPATEFSQVVDVNVKGVAAMVRGLVPAMIERGSGVIVNMSSGWGRSTSAEVAPYCATKWAIEGMTQALAQELPEGMAAVALNPGVIDTEMLRSVWGEGAASYEGPETWAERAVGLLSGLGAGDNGKALGV
jgi:NAD(P)-dependent dehydrogenase (short-subunit alcohol dehydrogenase family)